MELIWNFKIMLQIIFLFVAMAKQRHFFSVTNMDRCIQKIVVKNNIFSILDFKSEDNLFGFLLV